MHHPPLRSPSLVLVGLLLAGCTTVPETRMPEPLRPPKAEAGAEAPLTEPAETATRPRIEAGPTLSVPVARPVDRSVTPQLRKGEPVALSLDSVNLATFINEVFANQLGFSVEIDPAVRTREDLVTLRLVSPEPPERLYAIALEVLRRYGVRVEQTQGLLRFSLLTEGDLEAPLVLSGRSLPEVPSSQRPVFLVAPLNASLPGAVGAQLRTIFGARPGFQVAEMLEANALMLSGPPAVVQSALDAIRLLDRPALRDKQSLRINPQFIPADQLAKDLREVLTAQGYSVRTGPGSGGAIALVPVASANALIAFSESEDALAAVEEWVETLDQPGDDSAGEAGAYIYSARHTTVESLQPVLSALLEGAAGNKLVVDPLRNAIVFQGEAQRWRSLQSVLSRLDQPARQVVIEVTVAEVTLTDEFSHGVEWALKNAGIGNFDGPLTIFSGSGSDASGIVWSPISGSGQVKAVLNAIRRNSRVSILSTPRIMVRSGETASIDVGTEVPIITSQATAPDLNQPNGPSILQQVQYRKTGVLLEIEAVVHSGQRVDLGVSQEVSEARATDTSSISSPSIFSRKIKTALSLSDGDAMLLGGLISATRSKGGSEVPGLGRIPLLGKLFQNHLDEGTRTELLVLITPYVVEDAGQAREITEALRDRFETPRN